MRIAIVGKMRSGKDTVASLLTQKDFRTIAFADGITEIISNYFPEAFEDGKPRKHYQHIGQELRKLNPDVWINYLHRRLLVLLSEEIQSNILVTDCRQKNEELYLRRCGFMIVKVVADDEVRKQRIIESGDNFSPEQFYHETEIQVDSINADYLIDNNDSLKHLEEQVNLLFNYYELFFNSKKGELL